MSDLEQLLQETGYTENELVSQYRELAEKVSVLSSALSSIRVTSLIMVGGEPISVQLPQTQPLSEYDPEYLQSIRDALAFASVTMRVAKK
jgi:hypothetical protein